MRKEDLDVSPSVEDVRTSPNVGDAIGDQTMECRRGFGQPAAALPDFTGARLPTLRVGGLELEASGRARLRCGPDSQPAALNFDDQSASLNLLLTCPPESDVLRCRFC